MLFRSNDARYYVGYIVWRPGELRSEIDRKVWNVVNASPDVVFRKDTSNLWEELSRMARAITASVDDGELLAETLPAIAQH